MVELARRLTIRERPPRRVRGGVSPTVLLLLAAACIFLVVGSLQSSIFAQQTVAGLAQGAIFGSLALALVLIYRATEVINFAQGEMAMATTYIAYQLNLWGLSYWAAFFRYTKIGLGMRAGAVRPAAARLVGVRTDALLAVGWGLAAVLGAVAGLMTEPTQFLQPTMMQSILLYAFAAAVLGGLESAGGAVVGGLALGVFLNLVGQYVGFVSSELRLPVAFAVLLVVLVVKPTGLFGRTKVRRV